MKRCNCECHKDPGVWECAEGKCDKKYAHECGRRYVMDIECNCPLHGLAESRHLDTCPLYAETKGPDGYIVGAMIPAGNVPTPKEPLEPRYPFNVEKTCQCGSEFKCPNWPGHTQVKLCSDCWERVIHGLEPLTKGETE